MGPAAATDAAAKAEAEGIDGGVLLSTDSRCVALNRLGLTKETAMKLASAIEELCQLEASSKRSREQRKPAASLALPVAHDAAWQNPLSASLVGGGKVRRSAGCISKRAAICAAAVVLLLVILAAVAVGYAMRPAPSPCVQPDTAGGDPCTTPVALGTSGTICFMPGGGYTGGLDCA
jgi:hypothetical protein